MQITLDHKEWYKIKVFDKDGNPLTRLIYINTESGAYESRSLTFSNKNDVGILEEGFKVEIPVEEEYTNRCCGRCDGDYDIMCS